MVAVFRAVRLTDLEQIYQLALGAGFGITTLPKNKEELALRIQRSVNSFQQLIEKPFDENYFFVLEDLETNTIVGTSAIEAAVGHDLPFYSYRVSRIFNICTSLDLRVEYDVLTLNNDLQGRSELGTLYLHHDARVNNNGLLLSRARLLFMAFARHRFNHFVIAEMRGVSDEDGISPFWESFGRHFFKMTFDEADRLSVLTDKQFISDLLPHHPVHINLLSEAAQQAVGQPHASTMPAMKILAKEGFRYNYYVHIFDAGPTIEAEIDRIKTIIEQQQVNIVGIENEISSKAYFISNNHIEFRAVKGTLKAQENGIIISTEVAQALDVVVGDSVQIIGM